MLYFINSIPNILPSEIRSYIPDERIKRANNYHHNSDRILCMLAYYAFAYGMERRYGVSMKSRLNWNTNKSGKPFLTEYSYINFNISHCSKAVFCGFSREPIGVDVQDIICNTEPLLPLVCTENERKRLETSNAPDKLFTWFWCLKEAYFKQKGTGITAELNKIDFSDFEGKVLKKYELYFSAFEISGCCFAVCGKEAFTENDLNNIAI